MPWATLRLLMYPFTTYLDPDPPFTPHPQVNVVLPSSFTPPTPPTQPPQQPTMSSQSSNTSSDAPTDASTQRLSLNDLPDEVKQRIVELCAEQDERFRKWLEWAAKHGSAAPPTKKGKLTAPGEMSGKSVGALFRVSKKFSALAAPLVCKKLRTSKMDMRFKFSLPDSRLPLFTSLDLDSTDVHVLSDLIALLPKLSGLKSVTIRDMAFRKLWLSGPFSPQAVSDPCSRAEYATVAFKRLSGVVNVKLLLCQLDNSTRFIRTWSDSLRKVEVKVVASRLVDSDSLAQALSGVSNLSSLKLIIEEDDASTVVSDLDPLLQGMTPRHALRTLTISANFPHSSHLSFAEAFSSTLTRLSFRSTFQFDGSPLPFTQPKFTTEVFPHVQYLSIAGHCSYMHDMMTSIEPQHFPNLDTLSVDQSAVGLDAAAREGLGWYPPQGPHPSKIVIPSLETFDPARLSSLRQACEDRGLQLIGGAPVDCHPSLNSTVAAKMPTNPEALALRTASVVETLEFVQEEVKKAEEGGGLASSRIGQLEQMLRPLEYEKLAAAAWSRA